MPGADVEDRRGAGLGPQHLETKPCKIGCAKPLDASKRRRVGRQKRGNTGDGGPHEHLVARNDAQGGGQAATNSAFARRSDQRQVPRAGNRKKKNDGRDERAVISDAEHADCSRKGSVESKRGRRARCRSDDRFSHPDDASLGIEARNAQLFHVKHLCFRRKLRRLPRWAPCPSSPARRRPGPAGVSILRRNPAGKQTRGS